MSVVESEGTTPTLDLDHLPDARIDGDVDSFRALLVDHEARVKNGASAATRLTNAAKLIGWSRVLIRSRIVTEKGIPDWSADSDSYRILVSYVENRALAHLTSDAKGKLTASVRQHVKRTMLLIGVVHFILTHYDPTKSAKYEKDAGLWLSSSGEPIDGTALTADQMAVLADPSPAVIADVRRHYKSAKLELPAGTPFAYDQAVTGGSGGPEQDDPTSVVETVTAGVDGLADIVPSLAAKQILRGLSILAERVMAGGEIEGRQEVVADCQRIAKLALLVSKIGEGKSDEKDAEQAKSLLYDPKHDTK